MNHETPKQVTKDAHSGHDNVPESVREVPRREYDLPLPEAAEKLINTEPENLPDGFAEHPLSTGEIRLLPVAVRESYTQAIQEATEQARRQLAEGSQVDTEANDTSEEISNQLLTAEEVTLPSINTVITRPTEAGTWQPSGKREKNPNVKSKWLIGSGSVAAIAATVVALVLSTPHDDTTTRRNPEDTSTPTTNSASAIAGNTPEVSSTPSSNTGNTEKFIAKSEILKPTKTLEQMDAMSVEEFAALSYADRFAFYKAKEPLFNDDSAASDEMLTQTPDDIPGGMWQPLRSAAFSTKDTTLGKKLYMSMFYYTTDPGTSNLSAPTRQAIQSVQDINGAGLSDGFEHIKSGQWQTGVDRSGNPIDFVDVTTHQLSSTSDAEVPNSHLTYQAIRVRVQTFDGSISYVYPQGYSTPGEGAPDPKYPY